MTRPVLLDLFCGAGGAAMGYYRAGFDVVGVDNRPQPRYPFSFILSDALEYVAAHGREYGAVHASVPCQRYSVLHVRWAEREYPDLLPATRAALLGADLPYIIENVVGAPLLNPIRLCGVNFGLHVYRHRLFESNVPLTGLPHLPHPRRVYPQNKRGATTEDYITVTGDAGRRLPSLAMRIDWMTGNELSQAIPPAYTEFIGAQLLRHLR